MHYVATHGLWVYDEAHPSTTWLARRSLEFSVAPTLTHVSGITSALSDTVRGVAAQILAGAEGVTSDERVELIRLRPENRVRTTGIEILNRRQRLSPGRG